MSKSLIICYVITIVCVCGDSVDNTVEENYSIFSLIQMCWLQEHACSKTLHQQNPTVLNWRCHLRQVDLYNGRKTVIGMCKPIY